MRKHSLDDERPQIYHELKATWKQRKVANLASLLAFPIACVLHAVALAVVLAVARWALPDANSTITAILVAAAYVAALLTSGFLRLQQNVEWLQMQTITVQDEILTVQKS